MSILQGAGGAAGNKELYCPGSGRVSPPSPFPSLRASCVAGGGKEESARVFLWLAGGQTLLGSSCGWLPHCSPAFRSSRSHCLDPLHVLTSADTTYHSLLSPGPGSLAQLPHTHPTLLPAETFSLRSGPSQTPLSPPPGVLSSWGTSGEHWPLPHPVLQRQSFFSHLVLNTENVKVCLVLSS